MAYLLWALGWFFVCGIHRFYLGKPLTGLLWFFTGGLCLVGQIVDVFLIPGMVEQANRRFVGYGGPRD
jgi:TM2 domain-containing membrane protein YozV